MKLELTMQELQLIVAGLREMPYKNVVELLQNIDRQVIPQLQPQQEQQNGPTD